VSLVCSRYKSIFNAFTRSDKRLRDSLSACSFLGKASSSMRATRTDKRLRISSSGNWEVVTSSDVRQRRNRTEKGQASQLLFALLRRVFSYSCIFVTLRTLLNTGRPHTIFYDETQITLPHQSPRKYRCHTTPFCNHPPPLQ